MAPKVEAKLKTIHEEDSAPAGLDRNAQKENFSEQQKVTHRAIDFDFLDPEWVENPYPIWDELRSKCPIAHSDRYISVYLPTRYADVREIALDTEHFSSHRNIMREGRPPSRPHRPSRQIHRHIGHKGVCWHHFLGLKRSPVTNRELGQSAVS